VGGGAGVVGGEVADSRAVAAASAAAGHPAVGDNGMMERP